MSARHLLALFCLAVLAPAAAAEHAVIDLRVSRLGPATDPDPKSLSAHADTEPPAGGLNPRPLLRVKLNEPLELQFMLTNNYPHGDKKNVAVRFFIVRQEKPRQKTVPDHEAGVVAAGRFTMNFKPNCRVRARVTFLLKEAGFYLVRVETGNTDSDHEHFSAIDLQAE